MIKRSCYNIIYGEKKVQKTGQQFDIEKQIDFIKNKLFKSYEHVNN